MNMKKVYIALLVSVIFVLSACVDGRDDVYKALPDIEIVSLDNGKTVSSQFYQGDTLKLNPVIQYGDKGNEDFNFHWYIQTTDSLIPISDQEKLAYRLDNLGSQTFRLEVVNKETNVSASTTLAITVVGRSELGWYILKGNSAGNTDLDFFRVSTDGTMAGIDADLLKQRDCVLKGQPKSLLYTYNYSWMNPETNLTETGISAFIPVSEEGMASFRLSDVRVLKSGLDLFYDDQDRINGLEGGGFENNQVVLINKGRAHLMVHGMMGFLPEIPGTYYLSPVMTVSEGSGSQLLGFDNTSHSFIHISPKASSLSYFPDNYFEGQQSKISSNNMNGTISFMENTAGNLNPDTIYTQRAYALFHENGRSDRCVILGLDLAQTDDSQSKYGEWQYSPIQFADTVSYSKIPGLQNSSALALNKDYPILYYADGNTVSSYNIESRAIKTNVLSFPAGEEITYMHYIVCDYDANISFRYFVVATYDTASGSYKIYRYSISGSTFHLEGDPMTGEGKVKTVIFASPNRALWQSSSFRYF